MINTDLEGKVTKSIPWNCSSQEILEHHQKKCWCVSEHLEIIPEGEHIPAHLLPLMGPELLTQFPPPTPQPPMQLEVASWESVVSCVQGRHCWWRQVRKLSGKESNWLLEDSLASRPSCHPQRECLNFAKFVSSISFFFLPKYVSYGQHDILPLKKNVW